MSTSNNRNQTSNGNGNTDPKKSQSSQSTRQSSHGGGPFGRGGPMAMMKGDKARDFKGTMKKLIAYLGPHKLATVIVIILSIVSTVFSIFGPKILGQATTKLFEGVMGQITGTGSGIDFNAIGRILLTVLGLYILSAVLSYIQGWVMAGVAVDITYC